MTPALPPTQLRPQPLSLHLMGQFKDDLRFLPPLAPSLPVHLMGQYSDALLHSLSLYLMGQFKEDLRCCAVVYFTDIVVLSPGRSVRYLTN